VTTYDDKTKGIIESEGRFILPLCEEYDDVTFKASYIVVSNIKCTGKLTALFDFIALGDVVADEIDIKGKFVCLGNCTANGSIVVQNEIWANDLRAKNIESQDRIVTQEIDTGTIFAEGSIVVGKILAIEKLAKTEKNIICGETAYGAGKVFANTVITGEPIDLDDGEDAVESPKLYRPTIRDQQLTDKAVASMEAIDVIAYGETEFADSVNFVGYLDFLYITAFDEDNKSKYKRWKEILSEAKNVNISGINDYSNIAIIIWLAEIVTSDFFKNWQAINENFSEFETYFTNLIVKDKSVIRCEINTYQQWLDALSILNRSSELINPTIFNFIFEQVVSNIGLKAKFVSERLKEKGWEAHG
jgi:hypothetical protein